MSQGPMCKCGHASIYHGGTSFNEYCFRCACQKFDLLAGSLLYKRGYIDGRFGHYPAETAKEYLEGFCDGENYVEPFTYDELK